MRSFPPLLNPPAASAQDRRPPVPIRCGQSTLRAALRRRSACDLRPRCSPGCRAPFPECDFISTDAAVDSFVLGSPRWILTN